MILKNNPTFNGMAMMRDDLAFVCEGVEQRITLILPSKMAMQAENKRWPLVVFLQGSGWTAPNRFTLLPQLADFAKRGIAVASITHRNSLEGHPFPAYLKDAKAAIRFLRKKAEELLIDTDKIGFLGTSSGGNTALLVGLTAGDERYLTKDYAEYSDAVSAVVDCFGPSDLVHFEGGPMSGMEAQLARMDVKSLKQIFAGQDNGMLDILFALFGENQPLAVAKAMSPVNEIKEGVAYPPFLIAQGDNDFVVPMSQSILMHEALLKADITSSLIQVKGAEHEGTFWSQELIDVLFDFFARHLMG